MTDPGDENDARISECEDRFQHVWRVEQRERDLPMCTPIICLRCLARGIQVRMPPTVHRVEISSTLKF